MSDAVTEIRPHEQAVVVAVVKSLLDPTSSKQAGEDVAAAAMMRPDLPVVLDMSKVKFAPSSALGMLLQLSRNFRVAHRRFVLVGVTPQVLGPMRATNLHGVVEILENIEQLVSPPGQ